MHHFAYRDGVLHAEDVSLAAIAAEVGTPFYCYSTATLERHYKVFAGAFADTPSLVCYAMKANSNQAVIATLARLGAGADVVSEGELKRARLAGVPPEKIMFSGVTKSRRRRSRFYGRVAGTENGLLASTTNMMSAVSSVLPALKTSIAIPAGCPFMVWPAST